MRERLRFPVLAEGGGGPKQQDGRSFRGHRDGPGIRSLPPGNEGAYTGKSKFGVEQMSPGVGRGGKGTGTILSPPDRLTGVVVEGDESTEVQVSQYIVLYIDYVVNDSAFHAIKAYKSFQGVVKEGR